VAKYQFTYSMHSSNSYLGDEDAISADSLDFVFDTIGSLSSGDYLYVKISKSGSSLYIKGKKSGYLLEVDNVIKGFSLLEADLEKTTELLANVEAVVENPENHGFLPANY